MKPLRPFPIPLGIGTDICQISRIYLATLGGHRGERFLARLFSPQDPSLQDRRISLLFRRGRHGAKETDDDNDDDHGKEGEGLRHRLKAASHTELARRDPAHWTAATFLAGRWAAKEAVIKAHSPRKLRLHQIMIEKVPIPTSHQLLGTGPSVARILSESKDDAAREEEEEEVETDESALVSISHDGDFATAVCLAYNTQLAAQWGKT